MRLFLALVILIGSLAPEASVASASPSHSPDAPAMTLENIENPGDAWRLLTSQSGQTEPHPHEEGDHVAHCAFACIAMIIDSRKVVAAADLSKAYEPRELAGTKEADRGPLRRPPKHLSI